MEFHIKPIADSLSWASTAAYQKRAALDPVTIASSAIQIGRHIREKDPARTSGAIGEAIGTVAGDFLAGFLIGLSGIETGPGVVLTSLGCGFVCAFIGRKAGQRLLTMPIKWGMDLAPKEQEGTIAPIPVEIAPPLRPRPTLAVIRNRAFRRALATRP